VDKRADILLSTRGDSNMLEMWLKPLSSFCPELPISMAETTLVVTLSGVF
jgi:hypothetical protein